MGRKVAGTTCKGAIPQSAVKLPGTLSVGQVIPGKVSGAYS